MKSLPDTDLTNLNWIRLNIHENIGAEIISMMKVLHILYSGLGGHGNVFFSMVDADKSGEIEYEALFFGIEDAREGYIRKAEARNIKWHAVKKKPGVDVKSFQEITSIILKSEPDIVFIHSSSYIFPVKNAVLRSKKKIRIVVRETQPNHLKTKQEWLGLSVALMVADKVVFLSKEYKAAIKKKLSVFFSEKRTAVIPNGIDLDIYKPAPQQDGNFLSLGMQSRLSATKDHATLIRAFKICLGQQTSKPLRLVIAGDGECRPQLEELVTELGISDNVIFKGMLEESELAGFINSLDIYIHATLGETMSTAIMQVMACKLPIVASDVLGVNNMIQNNINGFLVPAKDERALAMAIMKFLSNEQEQKTLANAAYTFAKENYSNRLMLDRYRKIFFRNVTAGIGA